MLFEQLGISFSDRSITISILTCMFIILYLNYEENIKLRAAMKELELERDIKQKEKEVRQSVTGIFLVFSHILISS